jgi:hypothetical protein
MVASIFNAPDDVGIGFVADGLGNASGDDGDHADAERAELTGQLPAHGLLGVEGHQRAAEAVIAHGIAARRRRSG